MKKIKFILVFLPMLIGVLIYLLYRSKNLYYYNLIHFLNINGYVLLARETAILYIRLQKLFEYFNFFIEVIYGYSQFNTHINNSNSRRISS